MKIEREVFISQIDRLRFAFLELLTEPKKDLDLKLTIKSHLQPRNFVKAVCNAMSSYESSSSEKNQFILLYPNKAVFFVLLLVIPKT